ncbi:hypothetical protein A9R05_14490 [Burkholderia sp. KK1]|nr:hypothetical protein A9R05_14490 [Burkholderia sp. KK1]
MNQRRLVLKSLVALPVHGLGINAFARTDGSDGVLPISGFSDLEAKLMQSTGVHHGPLDMEILNFQSDLEAYAGKAARVFLRKAGRDDRRQARIFVRYADGQPYHGQPVQGQLVDALGRIWRPEISRMVDVRKFGPAKGGDYTASLMRALAEPDVYVWVPPDARITAVDVVLPSHTTVVIDGSIALPAGAPLRAAIFTNADQQQGNSYIALLGDGSMDGSNARQDPNAEHELVRFNNCSSVAIQLAEAGGNRFSKTLRERSGAAIHIVGGRNHFVSVGRLQDYGREGVWLHDVSDSIVCDMATVGGAESWSGVQVGGPTSERNRISGVETRCAGASGIGCDSKSSLVLDCSSRSNRYFHGFNFGHSGQPADDSKGIRLLSISAGTEGARNDDFNGFSVVNGSQRVTLIDCVADRAFRDGFNTSAGADESSLIDCTASRSGRFGINAYGATVIARSCSLVSNVAGAVSPSGKGRVIVE